MGILIIMLADLGQVRRKDTFSVSLDKERIFLPYEIFHKKILEID
jgi:hypothetical protein